MISPRLADFQAVVQQAIELARPSMEQRSQSLKVSVPPGQINVRIDEMRLSQVLQNLLSNASKFTPTGGTIEVTVYVEAGRVFVSVADDGVGMDPATIDDLFQLFVQGECTQDMHLSGLGIGLALSRAIIEMHGGKISGASAGPGMGSTFRFELPGATYVDPTAS